jgi:serine/threonine protein kinase
MAEEIDLSGSESSLNLENADEALDLLTTHLERFLDAWEAGDEPPRLAEFVPEQGECRRLALVELIKIDLEYRWGERNIPKRLGEYAAEFPELAEGGVPADLVYEEFHIRRSSGFNVDPREYLDQFPDQAEELGCMLGLEQSYQSTSLFGGTAKRRLDEIEVGHQLDDFDLLSMLGEGNFARVFLARQRSMQRMVALKISADSGSEPQTLAQFDHDYIVRVFDQRQVQDRRLRLLYMQYVAGGTLQHVVRTLREFEPAERNGEVLVRAVQQSLENRGEMRPADSAVVAQLKNMTWPEVVCWVGARLAEALDYAHHRGVLHRDIKPANVLLSAEGIPKLADFNISFCSKISGATPAAYFGGSLAYMSPEQLEACNPVHSRAPESLDARSDLYALGVVLWELLTGARPFNDVQVEGGWSKTLSAMSARRRQGLSDDSFKQLPEDCPPGLVRVLTKCLAPQPEDRWDSGKELATQLEFCSNREVQELLHPSPTRWRSKFGRWPLLFVFLAVGIPNGLLAVLNHAFNDQIMQSYSQDVVSKFEILVLWINIIAFSVGLGTLIYLTHTVTQGVAQMRQGETVESRRLARIRWLALFLGQLSLVIGSILWALAGLAYPASMQLMSVEIAPSTYAQFFGSLLICGLIASAYPFFGVTYMGLGILYPGLLLDDLSASNDVPKLKRLGRYALVCLIIAATVPLLGILLLLTLESYIEIDKRLFRITLAALSLGGMFGFGLLFWRYRVLQRELDLLIGALSRNK